uniref:PPM-type phosphatase domain-containing protein n=1 Tax=Eutreptiella gymnastica TaxID=73025 RepID=A0A7S1IPP1_9EUGL
MVTGHNDSGSTAAFAITRPHASGGGETMVGNIGDARVLVGRGGKLLHCTTDHKPTLPEEVERVQACGGFVDYGSGRVDGLLAVSRAFGDRRFKAAGPLPLQQKVIAQPSISTVLCQPTDFLVIACDGIFERDFSNEEVVAFVHGALAANPDSAVAVASLCEEALRRGSGDNMTAMVVQFTDGQAHNAAEEVLPPPHIIGSHELAPAFQAFLKEAECEPARALETRYHLLCTTLQSPRLRQSVPASLLEAMESELGTFGGIIPSPAQPGQRTQYFEALAAYFTELLVNPHDPQVPDPRQTEDINPAEPAAVRRFNSGVLGSQKIVAPDRGTVKQEEHPSSDQYKPMKVEFPVKVAY